MPQRRTYTSEEKEAAVAKAKIIGIVSASKELQINECLIRRWSKKKHFPVNRLREEGGGRKPILPQSLEKELVDWVQHQKDSKTPVTTTDILLKMESYKSQLPEDNRLKKWPRKHNVYHFLKRYNLELRDDLPESPENSPKPNFEKLLLPSETDISSLEKACILFLSNPQKI